MINYCVSNECKVFFHLCSQGNSPATWCHKGNASRIPSKPEFQQLDGIRWCNLSGTAQQRMDQYLYPTPNTNSQTAVGDWRQTQQWTARIFSTHLQRNDWWCTVPSESIHTPWLFPHIVVSLAYTQYPVMTKWNYAFRKFYKWIKS